MVTSSAATLATETTGKISAVNKKLVLFDFDGTITTKDTLIEFLIHYVGPFKFISGLAMLSPILSLYAFRVIPNWKAKQMMLRWFLGGESEQKFNATCKDFSVHVLPKLIRPGALAAIEKHKQEGATVIVISASAENWVRPWCEKNGLLCIATRLEVKNHQLTGNLEGKNCYGPEKVTRLRACFDPETVNEIIAYGDSSGDKEMLALAHQKFYKPFRD